MHRSAHGINFMVGEIKPGTQNADPDLRILQEAKTEYAKLQ
jgi:hypothetical protein